MTIAALELHPVSMPADSYEEDEAPWALDAVRARIDARMAELGKTRGQIRNVKQGWGKNGPSLRLMIKIAKRLDWTLPELLGIRVADPVLLTYAVRIISEALSRTDVPDLPASRGGKNRPDDRRGIRMAGCLRGTKA